MRLTKEQQELIQIIAYDINCIDYKELVGDNLYHYVFARDNINQLVKELNIKVIPESE